ncbi:MAG: YihA family ribosome biogenesis GTP-binding protein [Clostridia bacterium]|nr:YihA family ribosome biogenesis GTP-binding protein [Clostridia bacterium]MBR6565128.1 YihA family ribosome biogenesis GTP-binding protein [Clostridia bacterium]
MNFNNAQFEKAFGTFAQLEGSDMPEICFCGRSNVGKSSLINKLLNRKSIARVSSKPGKTVTINFYRVDKIRLVDLPGYGYAKVDFSERQRWSELMEGYFKSGRDIKMAFQLIDMRHPATDFDKTMLDFLSQMEIPYTVVLTKADKLNKTETENRLKLIKEELGDFATNVQIVPFSAQNGLGAEDLRNIIDKAVSNG